MMRGQRVLKEELAMNIIFTSLSMSNMTKFSNVKLSGFTFEEPNVGSLKVVSTGEATVGNATLEDAIGSIAGAINEAATDRDRLMFELELVTAYFKGNKEISDFLEKILEKVEETDDWD
jgi:hypothetical protein